MKNTDNKRIGTIDVAKGLGIIFVIIGHLNYYFPDGVNTIISSFHMPLFFIISGYTSGMLGSEKRKGKIISKVRKLLVPYFLWALIFCGGLTDLEALKGIVYGNTNTLVYTSQGVLWFLPVMFLASVMFGGILGLNRFSNGIVFGGGTMAFGE